MIVYIISLLVTLLFSYLYTKTNNKYLKVTYFIATMLPFIVISSIRYDVGTDYLYRYAPDYLNIINGYDVPNLEIAFKLLIKLCILFSHDYILMFTITSIIINYFVFKTIFKYSKNIILSILLYFITSNYFISMNLVRQYISMSVLLYFSINYLYDKRIYKYITAQIISILFHTMSIVFMVTCFLKNKIIKPIYAAIATLILFLFAKNIIQFFITLLRFLGLKNVNKYYIYFENIKGDFAISAFIIEIFVYMLFYFIIKKLKLKNIELTKETIFYFNIQTISLMMIILSARMELWNRIEIFFGLFNIISIPYFYNILKKELNFDIKLITKKLRFNYIVYSAIIMIFIVRMTYSVIIKGSIDVLPYKTIIDRPSDIYSEVNKNELYNYNLIGN